MDGGDIIMPKLLSSAKLPNEIRHYRKRKNLRIKDVAEFMELASPSHIAHWEKGRKLPGLINALKLAYITGSTIEVLFLPLYNQIRHEIFIKMQLKKDKNHLPLI
jgi:transcriptional regulator with XRE-family HTH domain